MRERRPTRKQKAEAGGAPAPSRKFQHERDNLGYSQFHLTQKQKHVGSLIKNNDLVFVEGCAGSGKSLSVLYEFVRQYLADNTKQIVIVRTPVEAGDDRIGFLPDDLSSKIAPHFASSRKILEQLLSKGKVEDDLDHRIHFMVPNYVLGSTLDNSLVFIDEAQQIAPKILKLLLERIGKNSVCVVAGDSSQLYVNDKKRNALTDAVNRFFRATGNGSLIPRYESVEHFKYGIEDVQRSEIVKTVIKAYSDLL